MDRQGIGWFFGWDQTMWSSQKTTASFDEAFPVFHEIAVRSNVRQFVTGQGWPTSVSKLVDNTISAMR